MRGLLLRAFHRLYRLSRWNQRVFTPAGRLFVVLAVFTGALGLDIANSQFYLLFSVFFSLLLIALLAGRWHRPGLHQLGVTRLLPRFATVNETFSYRVQIENKSQRFQRQLLYQDEIRQVEVTPELYAQVNPESKIRRNWFDRHVGYQRFASTLQWLSGILVREMPVEDIAPGGNTFVTIETRPFRRGYIRFDGYNLTATDPLGLFKPSNHQEKYAQLLVLPQCYPVAPLGITGKRCFQPGGINQSSSVGDSTEFDGIREYRPGDPPKHMHWKSWARTGKPYVKQYQDEYFVRHALILDNFMTAVDSAIFEEAITLAASLSIAGRGQDDLLDLMFAGDQIHRVTAGRGLAGADQLLEILACLQAQPDKDFENLSRSVMQHAATMSNAVCVLVNWDERRQAMVAGLLAMGLPLLVILVVADSTNPVEAGPMQGQDKRFHTVSPGGARECLASL
jgi:uncharacterized protein (DUF58 family)